ncbi:Aminotransferase class I and II [Popillia japonica]|uniref:Aminotransferase class I and II n=1 Tax=Popillia japonica TaxID=7064 RepID=A0AAW1MNJ1_POPJA
MNKFQLPSRYINISKNVWPEYLQLALDYEPIDLGHGYPDFTPPTEIVKALKNISSTTDHHLHQYTVDFGHPRLVDCLAKLYSPLIGQEINPQTEILVTHGATGALFSTINGHVDIDDEVIIIEPFFDCYVPLVQIAGGIPKYIPLKPKTTKGDVLSSADWVLDPTELENMFNEKTKLIIINTPNNPLGKVFTKGELELIADLCKKWNVLCISDEVYEWMVYEPNKHIRIASLSGMWDRTITIGSAGKTFGITGWKTGWAYGPEILIRNLRAVHQSSIYTCLTPLQEAIAVAVEKEVNRFNDNDCYFRSMSRDFAIKRNFMADLLTSIGMKPIIPQGGYFMMADWSALEKKVDLSQESDCRKDYRFTKWMTKNVGVQAIPPTAFYSEPHKYLVENYVRYCFIKKEENLKNAAEILLKWKNTLK